MAEVASAYVSLLPSAKGFGKALDGQIGGQLSASGKSGGSKMSAAIGGVLKKSALGIGAAAGGILGTALFSGFKRLNSIDQAQAKLTGLGHSTKSVKGIMDDALVSVKGTAFGLDAAATTAAGAVAAGVKPGRDLQRTLKLVGDAATIAGTDMSSMGSIFNKVATANKIQGDVIAQLSDAGIPVVQLLAREMGVSAEETVKLASAGKINFKTFQNAMEAGLGGAALESGKTMAGAWANMKASLGRIGANLLSGVFPQIQGGIVKLTGYMSSIEPVATRVGEWLGEKFAEIGPVLGRVAGQVGTAVGKIAGLFGGDGGSGGLGSVSDFIQGRLLPAVAGIGDAFGRVVEVVVPIVEQTVAAIREQWGSIAPQLSAIWGSVQTILVSAMEIIRARIQFTVATISWLWRKFGADLLAYVGPALRNVVTIIRGAFKIVEGIFKTVAAVLKGDWKGAWDGIKTILSGALTVIKGAISQSMNTVRTIARVAWTAIKGLIGAAWDGIKATVRAGVDQVIAYLGAWASLVGKVRGWFGQIVSAIKQKFGEAVDLAKSIPGRITGALGNLGSLLYDKGRELIQGLINGITSKIGDIGSAMKGVAGKIKGYLPGSPVKEGPLKSWNNGGAGLRLMTLLAGGIRRGAGRPVTAMQAAAQRIVRAANRALRIDGKGARAALSSAMRSLGNLIDRQTKNISKRLLNGLGKGLAAGFPALRKRLRQLAKMMEDGLDGKGGKRFLKTLNNVVETLGNKLSKATDKAQKRVDKLKSKVKDLRGQLRELAAAVVQNYAPDFSTNALFGPDGSMIAGTAVSSFMDQLRDRKGTLDQVMAAYKKLLGQGLSGDWLQSLLASGNNNLILDLAGSSSATALEAQSLYQQVQSQAEALGQAVANNTTTRDQLDTARKQLEKAEEQLASAKNREQKLDAIEKLLKKLNKLDTLDADIAKKLNRLIAQANKGRRSS